MSFLLYFLGGLFSIFLLIIFVPIKIEVQGWPINLQIQWLIIKLYINHNHKKIKLVIVKKPFYILKKSLQKPASLKKTKSIKNSKKLHRNTKIKIFNIAYHNGTINKILSELFKCLKKLITSVRYKKFYYNFCYKDFYWQGIFSGLISSFPKTDQFQIIGNFKGQNEFHFIFHIIIFRWLINIMILLLNLPYWRMLKLYRLIK